MSKSYCRFCELSFIGIYLNCPKCGKWLAPGEGKDIAPDDEYEIAPSTSTTTKENQLGDEEFMTDSTKLMSEASGNFADVELIKQMELLGFELYHAEGIADWFKKDEGTSELTVYGARELCELIDEQKKLYADAIIERLLEKQTYYEEVTLDDESEHWTQTKAIPLEAIESERQRNGGKE